MVSLTPEQSAYVVGVGNRARYVSTYSLHICDEAKVIAFKDLMADTHALERYAEDFRGALYEAALGFDCSKCGALAGDYCVNLTKRKKGQEVPTRYPHQERLPEPQRIELEKQSPLFREKYEDAPE